MVRLTDSSINVADWAERNLDEGVLRRYYGLCAVRRYADRCGSAGVSGEGDSDGRSLCAWRGD